MTGNSPEQFAARNHLWILIGLIASLGVMGPYYLRGLLSNEHLDILVLYRPGTGDRDYLPLARQFAGGQFSEAYTAGEIGYGCVAFPAASVIAHGVALRHFGSAGFAVADVLTPCAYFLVAYRLLFLCCGSALLAALSALFFTLQGATALQDAIHTAFGYSLRSLPFYVGFLQSWELRFPRRFVTEIFLLGALGNWLLLARGGLRQPKHWWTITAVWMSALLQSDIYSFIALALAFSATALLSWKQECGKKVERLTKNVGLMLGLGITLSLPFLIQRTLATNDILERYGVFDTRRASALPLLKEAILFFPVSYVIVSLLIPWFASLVSKRASSENSQSILYGPTMNILAISGLCAMPTLVAITGQGVQLYHFRDTARTLLVWSVIMTLVGIAPILLSSFAVALKHRVLKTLGYAVAAVILISLLGRLDGLGRIHLENKSYPRAVGRPTEPSTVSYRSDLASLFSFVEQNVTTSGKSLATVDVELYAWWTGIKGGQSYLGHIFVSALNRDVLLERLAHFAYFNQVPTTLFVPWLTTETFNGVHGNWYSGNRYQATTLHTFASIEQYSPEELEKIRATPMIECWQTLIIPAFEKDRLTSYYQRISSSPVKPVNAPDLLLITNEFPLLRPDPKLFFPIYQNASFQLFKKKTS